MTSCVVLAAAVAACGGSDTDSGEAARTGTTATDNGGRAAQPSRTSGRDAKKASAGNETQGGRKQRAGKKRRPTLETAVARLSPAKRLRFFRRALAPLLKNVGITGSVITLSADRRTLTITVPVHRACRATTTDQRRITRSVREVLPFIERVVTVVQGGQSLASYVASNCDRAQLPTGQGQVVFEKSGYGSFRSKPLRIRSKRWTIEYAHQGSFFSVFVARGASGDRYEPETVISQRPGSGRKRYKGPGTFRLNINGSGDWTVRVRG